MIKIIYDYRRKIFTQKQIKEIIRLGRSGVGMVKISKKYKVNWKIIQKIFRNNNISPNLSRYTNDWNGNFFNNNNKEVAYWAGFLMADGSLYGNNKIEFVQKYNALINVRRFCKAAEIPLKKIKKKKVHYYLRGEKRKFLAARIVVGALGLKQSLKRWGIIHRKSYNFLPPKIDKKNLPHYLRGWFDGDGSIVIYKRTKEKKNYYQYDITGGLKSLTWYANEIYKLGQKIKFVTKRKSSTNSYYIRVNSSDPKHIRYFLKILKVRGNIHFEKKWNKYFKVNPKYSLGMIKKN